MRRIKKLMPPLQQVLPSRLPFDPPRNHLWRAHIHKSYHRIQKDRSDGNVDFDIDIVRSFRLLDAGPEGTVLIELDVDRKFANLNSVLHGGAACTILDNITTLALPPIARPGYWDKFGGVTRTLNISYLKAVPVGTTVRVHAEVVQHGKTMCMIRGRMTSVDSNTVYCVGEHHKVGLVPKPKSGTDEEVGNRAKI